MDDRARTLIITTLILLIIIGLIAGIIFYVTRLIKSRQSITNPTQTRGTISVATPTQTPARIQGSTPSPTQQPAAQVPTSANTKVFKGQGFELFYPKNWGLLTCTNSQNFELDPENSTDQKVACDVALKPVTVLVGSSECQGQTIVKGGVTFTKQENKTDSGVDYTWCTKSTPALEVSHRVSPANGRATSTKDFSKEIEEMISKIRFTQSS